MSVYVGDSSAARKEGHLDRTGLMLVIGTRPFRVHRFNNVFRTIRFRTVHHLEQGIAGDDRFVIE